MGYVVKSNAQVMTDDVLREMRDGVVPWRTPMAVNIFIAPKNIVTEQEYSGIVNVMNLTYGVRRDLNLEDCPYWGTYNQMLELGGHVRKGERGVKIYFYGGGRLKRASVFNMEQAEWGQDNERVKELRAKINASLPEEKIPEGMSWGEYLIQEAEKLVLKFGTSLEYTCNWDEVGYYPDKNIIKILPVNNIKNNVNHDVDQCHLYYSILFNLLTRSVMGKIKYQEEKDPEIEGLTVELTAELTTAYLMSWCGFGRVFLADEKGYLEYWKGALERDSELLVRASGRAKKIIDIVLTGAEGHGKTGEHAA
jgi:antirestriction protein ArdC